MDRNKRLLLNIIIFLVIPVPIFVVMWNWAAVNISNGFLAILLPILFLTISRWVIKDLVDYSERKK
jgi:hypothetical protein